MKIRTQTDLSGILFRNRTKKSETHSDYSGHATIDGQEFFINAWINEGRNGKFLGLKFKPRQDRPIENGKNLDDEIGF